MLSVFLDLYSLFLVNNTANFPLIIRLDILRNIFIILHVSESLASTPGRLVRVLLLLAISVFVYHWGFPLDITLFAIVLNFDWTRSIDLCDIFVDYDMLFTPELWVLLGWSSTRKTCNTIRIMDVLVHCLVYIFILAVDNTCFCSLGLDFLCSLFFLDDVITTQLLQIIMFSCVAIIELSLVEWHSRTWISR